ncbi:MAG: hypothetical protein IJP74_11920 [Prevotella sp.]|nr:hypothetical protein [Prevotella sp.]MBR0050001.1 hypothetical protein [Prevotella sp.]
MDRNTFVMVPCGGLANRMRATASAFALAQQTGNSLQIVWFRDWALNAPFSAIFKPQPMLPLREATIADHLLYDRARRHNLWLPALPQRLLFSKRLHEEDIWTLMTSNFDFAAWARDSRCYMSNYMDFHPYPSELLHRLFVPVSEVADAVDRFRNQLSSSNIVGIHIRRTDHVISIQSSPTSLFIDKIKEEIDAHADTKVFLATDSNDVKRELRQAFGQRIVTPDAEARRDGIDGIRGGLADMYTLAATHKIYGSKGSTFSKMAARLGNIPLQFLEK